MRTRNALLCAAAVTSVCLAVESPVVAKDPFAFGAGCISTLISLCRRYRNPRNRIRARWKEKNVRRLHRMLRTRQVKWKELDDANLRLHTRFDKDGLSRLIKVLHIPDPFVTTRRGYRFQAFDALCILCARLAYPARLSDLQAKFGIREARISACINDLSSYIYKFWSHLLDLPPNLVNPSNLERYASVIHAGGAPTKEVAAFLDGTINLICRPGTNQKIVYNGYYAGHALKFQGLCGPDGMMLMVYGPIEGRRADGGLLAASELISKWKNKGRGFGNRQLVIYADPAYAEGDVIMSGRKEVYTLPALEQQLNTEMSRYRQAIEWTFGKIYQNWHAFTLHDQQRLFLSPIGLLFSVACLLTNAHTCLYGSQTSQYFDLAPPTLEEYFVHI